MKSLVRRFHKMLYFFEYGVTKSSPYLSLVKACRYIRMSYGQISLTGSPRASPYR